MLTSPLGRGSGHLMGWAGDWEEMLKGPFVYRKTVAWGTQYFGSNT